MGQLREALDLARTDVSTALVVRGEPGVGKTSLLDELEAIAAGMQILRARPLQAESELPFAGLFDLVHPLIDLVDQLPASQATALSGALALGPPT